MNKEVWQKILSPNEKIKYEFTISENYRIIGILTGIALGFYFFALSSFLGVVFILFIVFYFGWYLKEANNYAFTNKRVLIHQGWIGSQLISVDYNKITDVTVVEPFLDKLVLRTGHLKINTAGADSQTISLKNLAEPYKIKNKLDEIREESLSNIKKDFENEK